ncbi:hypothetical protein [Thermomonospora cellulosilytica]|uniref:Uncharacterized protein n=1 Tax=Thermomonospora cellulosilytica TaxID=1411118 RepID=A0A7W3N4W5_9ACTN|nr:hypothetical protein [Thermomonospora cellulosilytica]MBA9007518.1 hypothetical protein [Thermomonospora cellulosilytica]
MSHYTRKNRRSGASRRSPAARLAQSAAGALAGGLAGRALRPVARRAARRIGLPAQSVIRVVEITAPVAAFLAVGGLAGRGGRGRTRRSAGARRAPRGRLTPRQSPVTASRN